MSLVHRLEGASVIRVQPREDRVLTAHEGRLWVTIPGQPGTSRRLGRDYVLVPGDRMLLRAGQKAVISSGPRGTASMFSVEAYAPAAAREPASPVKALQSLMMSVLGRRFAH